MARIYKTARGQAIDMDKIKLTNETAIAVGNMKVNARGDLIGAGGKITAGRNAIMDQVYAVPSASTGYSPNDPQEYQAQQTILEASNAQQLTDLANNLTVTNNATATADKQPTQPAARGSLANSVATPATVTQEPLPTPKEQAKSNGPSRI
jgi:hypothetical protein